MLFAIDTRGANKGTVAFILPAGLDAKAPFGAYDHCVEDTVNMDPHDAGVEEAARQIHSSPSSQNLIALLDWKIQAYVLRHPGAPHCTPAPAHV